MEEKSPPSPAAVLLDNELPYSPSLSASTYDSTESISERQADVSIDNDASPSVERSEFYSSETSTVGSKRNHLHWLRTKRKRKRRKKTSTKTQVNDGDNPQSYNDVLFSTTTNTETKQDVGFGKVSKTNMIYCYDHTNMMKQVKQSNTKKFNDLNILESPIESRFNVSSPPSDTKEVDAGFVDRSRYFDLDDRKSNQEQKGEKLENENENENDETNSNINHWQSPYTSISTMGEADEKSMQNLNETEIKNDSINFVQLDNLEGPESIMERRLRTKKRPWLHPLPSYVNTPSISNLSANINKSGTNTAKIAETFEVNSEYYVPETQENTTSTNFEPISSANTHRVVSWRGGMYINCDLRYFNLSSLGKFDMIIVDPPWRISGAQRHYQEANMFSNARFNLQYNTLSNEEIFGIDVGVLSDQGYCFLWVVNSALQLGIECLNRWGYTYVDRLTWVKKQGNNSLHISNGYYFLHSSETCLVGVKYKKGEKLQYIPKVSNDVIFADIREKSRKPDELYLIIEAMMPGARKIELFAKNHNIRKGWLSVGNRLGPNYETWQWKFHCDKCSIVIEPGNTRYKSRNVKNMDLCEKCFNNSEESIDDYYILKNNIEEVAFHDWFTCDMCSSYPICGVRFSCEHCENFDLCENCFDEHIVGNPEGHIQGHRFQVIEIPDAGAGFAVHHNVRCKNCLTCPILGERFHCVECDVDCCRNCFFKKKEFGNHRASHSMVLIPEPNATHEAKCVWCKINPISGPYYKCSTCLSFNLCERCYSQNERFPYYLFPAHKPYHQFAKITW